MVTNESFNAPILEEIKVKFSIEYEDYLIESDTDSTNKIADNDLIMFHASSVLFYKIICEYYIKALREGYLIFRSEQDFSHENNEISIMKTQNQYEVIRKMKTNGANYRLSTQDIIDKLKNIFERFPFIVIGAGIDWVEAVFLEKPDEMLILAKEIRQFCPDIVTQGTKTVKN